MQSPGGSFSRQGEGLVPFPSELVHLVVSLEVVEMLELQSELWLTAEGM